MKTIRKIGLSMSILIICLNHLLAKNCLSLEDAGKRGLVKLIIKSKGGFTGDVIEMKIKNLKKQNLELMLEAGRRLDSKNQNEQDILVTKEQEFVLNSEQFITINVTGMCCQAGNSCPSKNSEYSIGKMADTNLIKLAAFIDANKYYNSFAAQQAVWSISDHKSIGGINDGDAAITESLKKYVSKITGRPIPKYDVSYERQSPQEVLGHVKTIDGIFEYDLSANGHVTIAIYNSTGRLVQTLIQDIPHQKGFNRLYFTFRTSGLEQGRYLAKLQVDGKNEKEMPIEF